MILSFLTSSQSGAGGRCSIYNLSANDDRTLMMMMIVSTNLRKATYGGDGGDGYDSNQRNQHRYLHALATTQHHKGCDERTSPILYLFNVVDR